MEEVTEDVREKSPEKKQVDVKEKLKELQNKQTELLKVSLK